MATKICKDCHKEKPSEQFYTNPKGYQRKTCNSCITEWNRMSQPLRESAKAMRAAANRTHKTCPKCKEELPVESFSISKHNADGRNAYCRACDSVLSKASKAKGKLSVDQQPIEKTCAKCKQTFPIAAFGSNTSNKDGYNCYCKECNRSFWHNADDDKRKRFLLTRIKSKCKKYNLPFDLTLDDIVIPEVCPVLGIPLKFGVKRQDMYRQKYDDTTLDSPSVGRIIPELGYVKGNIVIVSFRANNIKNNATIDELDKIATFYKRLTSPAE